MIVPCFFETRVAIQKGVQETLAYGIMKASKSLGESPAVLVKKKINSLGFCVIYRKLSNVAKKYLCPLQRIDETLDRL